jgi:phosphoadenosine phosphosulfate reductase
MQGVQVTDQPRADAAWRYAIEEKAREFEGRSPQEILRWAVRTFPGKIALSSSFGGPTTMVVLDMLMAIDRTVPVSYIDTGFLFAQTYALIAAVERRYGIEVVAVRSELSPAAQAQAYGEALWSRDPDACCRLRKVAPQADFLAAYEAWITGLRRDQSVDRSRIGVIEWDEQFGLVKLNPLAHWDARRVWDYIYEHDLPYNPLNDRGFPSVGCVQCTRAIAPGEGTRDGRWPGQAKTECGLHQTVSGLS